MDLTATLAHSPLLGQPPLELAVAVVMFVAFVTIAAAIIADFVAYHRQDRTVARSGTSLVETGTMTAFFAAYYAVLRAGLGGIALGEPWRTTAVVAGLVLVVAGVVFNIWGRVLLGSSWANQIRIYEDQRLVTRGPYAIVRHPLYASLVWIFVGGGLVYANPVALVLALGVFVPMMIARARKEDALLAERFGEGHRAYRARTGMLLPRIRRSPWTT